jgi:hypothetical protein
LSIYYLTILTMQCQSHVVCGDGGGIDSERGRDERFFGSTRG